MTALHRYRARWVFPVAGDPIENGVVEVQGDRIVALHGRAEPGAGDLGNAAIIPGLVNVHTHLEFSDLEAPLRPDGGDPAAAPDFTDWIRAVVAERRARPVPLRDGPEKGTGTLGSVTTRTPTHHVREPVPFSGQPLSGVQRGVAESAQAGTTLLGEIATSDESLDAFAAPGPQAVVFRELIGLLPERADGQLTIARRHLEGSGSDRLSGKGDRHPSPCDHAPVESQSAGASPLFRTASPSHGSAATLRGLSPHAPYSVHPDLFRRLVEMAADRRAPVAVHLAETEAELELLRHGTGPFVRLLREFGVWRDGVVPRDGRPLDYLRLLASLERALVVHGNYLADDELDFLALHPHLAVVYCPRTHAWFGHREHPWRILLERGASVALGTDSRASNPDLSLWREIQFLHSRFPEVLPRTLLELGTLAGARALALDQETGSLTPGRRADLAVVALPPGGGGDPYAALLDLRSRVAATMCAGDWIRPQA